MRTKSYPVPILVWLHTSLSDYWLYVSSEHSSVMGFAFIFSKNKNTVNLVTSRNSKDSESRERLKWAALGLELIGLPCWLSGRESASQFRRPGFDPWCRKILRTVEQQSPCATTSEPVLSNKRNAVRNPHPATTEEPSPAATREKAHTATKTQRSQTNKWVNLKFKGKRM